MTYTKKMIQTTSYQETEFKGTLYQPKNKESTTTILYLHGGGFIFGEREDLPEPYIELLTNASISILSVDYPLAPENTFKEIIGYLEKFASWFLDNYQQVTGNSTYYIMGRSAGGFLALYLGRLLNQSKDTPGGIISLYGYYNLLLPHFTIPNRHYLKYPKVKKSDIDKLLKQSNLLPQNRYTIYIYGRQKGQWINLLATDRAAIKDYSLSQADIKELPPLFLAAGKEDPDVPSQQSEEMARLHSQATLKIYDTQDHDFDRTQVHYFGLDLYQSIIDWIQL